MITKLESRKKIKREVYNGNEDQWERSIKNLKTQGKLISVKRLKDVESIENILQYEYVLVNSEIVYTIEAGQNKSFNFYLEDDSRKPFVFLHYNRAYSLLDIRPESYKLFFDIVPSGVVRSR